MRLDKYILSIILLTASLAYTLWFVFAGFGNHQDPLYWLYKYEHLEGGWMAIGTLLTGGGIVKLFGSQLLPLRIAGWVCTTGAIVLPYCVLLTREQRQTHLHWLAMAFLLTGYGSFQEFSPGTLTVLLLSTIWVTAVKAQTTDAHLHLLTAILAGIAVCVRFPNILVIVVLVLLWKRKSIWYVPVAAITAGCIYLIGYQLITPAVIDPAISSHAFGTMVKKLWEGGGKLVSWMLLCIGVLVCNKRLHWKPCVKGPLMGLVLVYIILYALRPTQWYNTDLTYLVSALCIVIVLSTKQKQLYVATVIMAVATLGTDTAWLKLFPAVLCILPIVAVYLTDDMRRSVWWTLAVMSSVVVIRMSTNSVGQTNLTKVDTLATMTPYRHIAIREAEQRRIAQYKADMDSLDAPVLAFGQDMHLIRAVTGCEAARFNEFWSNIYDSVYTAKYQDVIQAERPIVFCSFSPQFRTQPSCRDKQSRLENMLRAEGYREIDRSRYKYMIYIPADRMNE